MSDEVAEAVVDDRERLGVKAIIHLQSMAHIVESEEQAIAGWRGMSEREKEWTLKVYGWMTEKGDENGKEQSVS